MMLDENELGLILHATGCNVRGTRQGSHGHRNYFVAGESSRDDVAWRVLVARGFAERYRHWLDEVGPPACYYTVTPAGARAAGLSEAAIVRACGTPEERAKQRRAYERARETRRRRRWADIDRSRVAYAHDGPSA